MPSLQQLRYVVALADTLNFSRAAEKLNVTQPTLSMQIRELEARLGATLFERNRAKVLLTPTGAEIARRARDVLREVEAIRDIAAAGGEGGLRGMLRLGVVHTVGAYLLSVAMPALRRELPDLRLYVREDRPDLLIQQLVDGVHDALILPENPDREGLTALPLFEEQLLAVLPAEHPLAGKAQILRSDLAGETILTMEPWHRLSDQIAELSREVGAHLARDYEGTSLDTLRQMVAMGMGVALMPALYIRSEVQRETLVTARPFVSGAPVRNVMLVWRSSNPQGARFTALAGLIGEALRQTKAEL